jgi:muramoyltetrapeptide carboxypeptidase LdcA involved in peptidoglycan recycling
MTIKPPALRPGDKVAAVSLSKGWPALFTRAYLDGKRQIQEAFGLKVVEGQHALADPDWLAAHPEARAADLMQAILDPSIHAIFSTIGGDDSIRILPYLDFASIRAHPKIFLGYSDSTVTHFAFLQAGVTSFYGPSIMAGFDENRGLFPYTTESVRAILFDPKSPFLIQPNTSCWTCDSFYWDDPGRNEKKRNLQPCEGWRWLQGTGRHRGNLVGGCLEVMDWLRGSQVWPDPSVWRESILFAEVSEDCPTPLSVMCILRAMAAAGALGNVRGVLFGRPYGDPLRFEAYDKSVQHVLAELGLHDLPLVTRMDFGHTDPKFVVPYGVEVEIDCDRRQLRLLESPVAE